MAAVTNITLEYIDALLQEFTSEEVRCSVNELAPAWAKMKPFKSHGGIGAVDLSISIPAYQLTDGAAYPTYQRYAPMGRLTYQGKLFGVPIKIPYGATKVADGKGASVNMVSTQLKRASEAAARLVGRAFLVNDLTTVLYTFDHATTYDNATTLTVTDPTGWRAGQLYESRTSGNTLVSTFRCDSVTPGASTYTIALTAVDGVSTGVGDVGVNSYVVPASAYGQTLMVSLTDVCTSSLSVYGQASTVLGWSPTTSTSSTQATAANVALIGTKIQQKRGLIHDITILSPARWHTMYNSQVSKIQYQGSTMDDFGKKIEFFGSEVIVDPNCPEASVFMVQSRDIFKDIFSDWESVTDGGGSANGARALHVDQSYAAYFANVLGIFQTRAELRNGCGMLTAATA